MGTRIDDATQKVTLVGTDKIPLGDGSFLPKYYEVSQIAEYAVSTLSAAHTSVVDTISVLSAARASVGQAVSVNTAALVSINSILNNSVLSTAQGDARYLSTAEGSSLVEGYGFASVNVVSTMISAANIFTIANTSGRDLALTDINKYIVARGTSAVSMRIPTCASVAFPIGTQLLFRMRGTGKLSVSAGVGVSVQVPSSCSAEGRGQGSTFSIIKYDSDTWDITGDLSVK